MFHPYIEKDYINQSCFMIFKKNLPIFFEDNFDIRLRHYSGVNLKCKFSPKNIGQNEKNYKTNHICRVFLYIWVKYQSICMNISTKN